MRTKMRSNSLSWFVLAAVGLFFAVFVATLNQVRISLLDPPPGTSPHLSLVAPLEIYVTALVRWLTYAALAPLVGALVRAWPLRRGALARRIPVHLGAATLFAVVHNAAVGILLWLVPIFPRAAMQQVIGLQLVVYLPLDFVVFWGISGAYHAVQYHRDSLHREQLAATLRAGLARARLDALRAQLNPHFLFNTLNSISSLALTGERERVVQTLSDLSDLLRMTLDRELPQEIPLARELEILELYLQIQRVRFGDRLTVETDVAPDARGVRVPAMFLQPLVENAFQHGIGVQPGPGRVSVRARMERDELWIRIEDSGPGFGSSAADLNGGIGLANTRARLEQLYGEQHAFAWGDRSGGGAFVDIRLPREVVRE